MKDNLRIKKIIKILCSLFFINLAFASSHLCNESKNLPKLIESCEGEACGFYHYDKALEDIPLYEEVSIESRIVATIKKCEKFKSLTPVMKMKSFGTAKVITLNDSLLKKSVKVGDIVTLFQDQGEGYLALCIGDKKDIQGVMEGMTGGDTSIAEVSVVKNTVNEPWVKLTTIKGVVGFTPRKNNIMWYAMIDEKLLCGPEDKKLLRHF